MEKLLSFDEYTRQKGCFEKGQRHNSIPIVIKSAKTHDMSYEETAAIEREAFGDEWKKEEKNFMTLWNTIQVEPKTDFKKKDENDVTTFPEFNRKFLAWIQKEKTEDKSFNAYDTSILKWFFKDGDLIHIVNDEFDKCEKAHDCRALKEDMTPMRLYQFMSVSTYKEYDMKRNQQNLKELRYVVLESDCLPLELQKKFFYTLIHDGMPVKSIVYSGGKSLHCLLKIHPMKNIDEYKEYCEQIYNEFNKLFTKSDSGKAYKLLDTANKDGIRYTRVPFGYRTNKGKTQDLIWCDEIEADSETYDFRDTLEQVKDYVARFYSESFDENIVKTRTDANGFIQYPLLQSLENASDIDDVFIQNGKFWIKKHDNELQTIGKSELWNEVSPFIKDEIKQVILEHKDERHQKIEFSDFFVEIKDIKFEVSLEKNNKIYNLYKPGFITQCQFPYQIDKIPSEFEKLLDNIADSKCKEWLLNHLACHFKLIKDGFKRNGADYVLETVPVFYGMSGTGKNTLLDIIGQAISELGTRYISIGQISDDFNEYFMAGAINVNEAAKGKTERRTSREALKSFTDKYQCINMKFMPKIKTLNTAYKTISANKSLYGVLDIDEFDRRFQYITGGGQLNAQQAHLCDMEKLNSQKYEFIGYLLQRECDFEKAQCVFDNEAKLEDKLNSLPVPERIALEIFNDIEQFPYEKFSARTISYWYKELHDGKMPEIDIRYFGRALSKYFGEKRQATKELDLRENKNMCIDMEIAIIKRGERYYNKPS